MPNFGAYDRIRESNVVSGTGNVTLGGSVAGYQTFASQLANGNQTWYAIVDNVAGAWEVGLGTWNTGGTLTRTFVFTSSNSNALVSFAGNTCDMFGDLPAAMATPAMSLLFGNGSDGNLTISSGLTTITRDMCYSNLTISGSGQINTNGYRLFVAGVLDISAAGANAITNTNGGQNAGSGGAGGAVFASYGVTLNGPGVTAGTSSGGAGGGVGAVGVAGGIPTSAYYGMGGGGGAGGAGGASNTPHAGGIASVSVAPSAQYFLSNPLAPLAAYVNGAIPTAPGVNGSGGGGGGGATATNGGSGGGSGGSGGAFIAINANIINRGSNSTANIIQAEGATGGAGASAGANAGAGGGGGGGGGGMVYIVTNLVLGSAITNAINASGGTGGVGGTTSSSGKGGNGGQGGSGGAAMVMVLSTQTTTFSTNWNVAGAAGSTTATITGAAGGAGQTVQMNL